MTKQQIIAELRRLGIPHRAKAPKDELERLLASAQKRKRGPQTGERVFGEPRKAEDVTPARAGTKRALILESLHRGCTIDELAHAVGWSRSVAQSALRTDVVNGNGLGVSRDADGVLHLILPKGMVRPPIVEADQDRETARMAACK